jgi:hypothetical protein
LQDAGSAPLEIGFLIEFLQCARTYLSREPFLRNDDRLIIRCRSRVFLLVGREEFFFNFIVGIRIELKL